MRGLSITDGDDLDGYAGDLHLRDEPSGAEDLVIGVRRDHDDAARPREGQRWELAQRPRRLPFALGCPEVGLVDD